MLADNVEAAVYAARRLPGFEEVQPEELREMSEEHFTFDDIMTAADVEDSIAGRRDQEEEGGNHQEEGPAKFSMTDLSVILSAADTFRTSVLATETCEVKISELVSGIDKLVLYQ